MAVQRMEGEAQEALFSSYPCATLYYVQSPSTASHANSVHSDCNPSSESALLSPFPNDNFNPSRNRENSRFTLSRYSSSRGSNNSFLHDKKITYDLQSRDSILKSGRLRIVDRIGEDVGNDDEAAVARRSQVWRFIALDPSSSCCCITVQIFWRFLLSIGVALLVFFLVTRPPSPKISFKVAGFKQFSLSEGLDNTGVVTKILTSNCSVNMVIDNNSKVFGLHIHPPTLEMDFGRLKLAQSQVITLEFD